MIDRLFMSARRRFCLKFILLFYFHVSVFKVYAQQPTQQLAPYMAKDIAIIPRDGSQPYAKRTDSSINAVTVAATDGKTPTVYFGGEFTSILSGNSEGGLAVQSIAGWQLGTHLNTFGGQGLPDGGAVRALATDPETGNVFVGSTQGLLKISHEGKWEQMPANGISGSVDMLSVKDGLLAIGGVFSGSGDSSRNRPSLIKPELVSGGLLVIRPGSAASHLDERLMCGKGDLSATIGDGQSLQVQFRRSMQLRRISVTASGGGAITFSMPVAFANGTECLAGKCRLASSGPISQTFFNVVGGGAAGNISMMFSTAPGQQSTTLYSLQFYNEGQDFSFASGNGIGNICGGEILAETSHVTTQNGQWQQKSPTEMLQTAAEITDASITIRPKLAVSGSYQVFLITPPCLSAEECAKRTLVSVSITFGPNGQTVNTQVDQRSPSGLPVLIYTGPMQASNDGDEYQGPSVTISNPVRGQIAVDALRFVQQQTISQLSNYALLDIRSPSGNYSQVPISGGGQMLAFEVINATITFFGGTFPSGVLLFNRTSQQIQFAPNGGLNGAVRSSVLVDQSTVYVAGDFTATADQTIQLQNCAKLNLLSNQWEPLFKDRQIFGNGIRSMQYDPFRSQLHVFSGSIMSGKSSSVGYMIFDLSSGTFVAPSKINGATIMNVWFDSVNIYAVGLFVGFPSDISKSQLLDWQIVLIVLASIIFISLLFWCLVAVARRRIRQKDEEEELSFEDLTVINNVSARNTVSVEKAPINDQGIIETEQYQTAVVGSAYDSDVSSVESMEYPSSEKSQETMIIYEENHDYESSPMIGTGTMISAAGASGAALAFAAVTRTPSKRSDSSSSTVESGSASLIKSAKSTKQKTEEFDIRSYKVSDQAVTATSAAVSLSSQTRYANVSPTASPKLVPEPRSPILIEPPLIHEQEDVGGYDQLSTVSSEPEKSEKSDIKGGRVMSMISETSNLSDTFGAYPADSEEPKFPPYPQTLSAATVGSVGTLRLVTEDWGEINGDLQVKRGDLVRVLDHTDPDWVYGELAINDPSLSTSISPKRGILPFSILAKTETP